MENPRRTPQPAPPAPPAPLVLVAIAERRQRHELTDVLISDGFRVVTARDEPELAAQTQSHHHAPDAIVIDAGIAPPAPARAHDICTALHAFSLATPIVLIVPGTVSRAQEYDGLRAGAWAVLGTPTEPDALLLRLNVFIEPKRELDRLGAERLVDRVSGIYTQLGLTRRAGELAALATRQGLALACAVFRPAAELPSLAAGDRLAFAFKRLARVSDALGRTGRNEFALFAPARSTGTVARLVQRLTDNVERSFGTHLGIRAGYSAVQGNQAIAVQTLLAQARQALAVA